MNPFTYGKAVSGGDYCDRPEKERLLASYMKSGQNVLLQGERRGGKTSLAVKVSDVTDRIAKAAL